MKAIDFGRMHMIFYFIKESNSEKGITWKLDLDGAVPKINVGQITLRLPNKPGITTRE